MKYSVFAFTRNFFCAGQPKLRDIEEKTSGSKNMQATSIFAGTKMPGKSGWK